MIQTTEVIQIGIIRRPHGKQGDVQCQMLNEYWDNADAETLVLNIDGILVPWIVDDWRGKGADTLIMTLRGIDSEERALQLNGCEAYMLRRDLQEDEDESMLTWQDLVGYEIADDTEGPIGRIARIDETTINTLLELQDGRLIPAHEDLIVAIDPDKQVITMSLPLGL